MNLPKWLRREKPKPIDVAPVEKRLDEIEKRLAVIEARVEVYRQRKESP
jgi:tetrahydromethanopterin S-methyltransferase subunit G